MRLFMSCTQQPVVSISSGLFVESEVCFSRGFLWAGRAWLENSLSGFFW